jgi:prophage regulatory protein
MSNLNDTNQTQKEIRLIRLPEVLKKTGLSKTHIYRLMNNNEFPQTVSLGLRAVAFVESEVNQWIEQKLNKRDEVAA